MAHFAELDNNNNVIRVIVLDNVLEAAGEQWCHDNLGGHWKQTSYNKSFRKNYAGIGMKYDPVRDAFIGSQPFPSWVFNEETCLYDPPVPYPVQDMEHPYKWDEATLNWIIDDLS